MCGDVVSENVSNVLFYFAFNVKYIFINIACKIIIQNIIFPSQQNNIPGLSIIHIYHTFLYIICLFMNFVFVTLSVRITEITNVIQYNSTIPLCVYYILYYLI